MNPNRRQFLTQSIALAGLLPLVWAQKGFSQAPKPPKKVNPKTNKFAQSIGYTEKVDPKKNKDLVLPDNRLKTCWTCVLYKAEPEGTSPEKSKNGICQLMASQEERIVNAVGGCRSWGENAAMKDKKYQG